MSETVRLRSVVVIKPVMHRGQMQTQLTAQFGDCLHTHALGVEVVPNPTAKRDPFVIPYANVACFTPIDEEKALERELAAEAEAKAAAKIAAKENVVPKGSVLKGVSKFVKNPETGAIEEKVV